MAATIGTGSIVGVSTAILAGGPGAVFWMWITGVFGNVLMAIPNILMVLGLSGLIARETKHYVYDDNLDEPDKTPIPTVSK